MEDNVADGAPERADVEASEQSVNELLAQIGKLKEAVHARDRAIAVVAHDLRNPINVISHAAEALLRTLEEAPARRQAQRILDVAGRTTGLLNDLLDTAVIDEGKVLLEKRKVDLLKTVITVMESQQALGARGSVITSIDLSPDLPPLEADERRVREVLENLIGNALKFTRPGGTVTVGASAQAGEALVWVKDTGSGVAEEDMPHLFDRFWQAKKADRRGAGLGLSICKGIVEAHGGRIWVESVLEHGTTVFFTLPALVPPRVETVESEPTNLLLVDDKPENLNALQAILEGPEYRFLTAHSGPEALRIALSEPFSVALIDIVMPGMNGFEVAAHLKSLERCRDAPIIFVTALGGDPQEVHRAYEAGCADYLVKPLDPDIVRKKVAVFVNLSRRRD
jgi:CheY-like chemotaxis protein/nitrogen-specific signal transduction histidine kinase